ncbi:ankyrin repeat-containing domain protein [Mycena leptocephala]|nr:ankyrin repeat-containing domain protein [Mycena leptocephala]
MLMHRLLIEHGANVNVQGGDFGNALQAASYNGHINLVQLLIEQGATLMHRLLIEHSANVNAQGGHFGNALQAASLHGHINIVQLLIEQGADVHAQGGHFGNALQAASFHGHINIVQLLIEHSADVNAQGGDFGNALQAASSKGHMNIVQLLIEHSANANAQGGHFGNALQAASSERHIDIVQAALSEGHIDIVQLLIEHGADVNAQGGEYGSTLQAASYNGWINIAQLLIEHGVDVHAQGGKYGSALKAALYRGPDRQVQLILDHHNTLIQRLENIAQLLRNNGAHEEDPRTLWYNAVFEEHKLPQMIYLIDPSHHLAALSPHDDTDSNSIHSSFHLPSPCPPPACPKPSFVRGPKSSMPKAEDEWATPPHPSSSSPTPHLPRSASLQHALGRTELRCVVPLPSTRAEAYSVPDARKKVGDPEGGKGGAVGEQGYAVVYFAVVRVLGVVSLVVLLLCCGAACASFLPPSLPSSSLLPSSFLPLPLLSLSPSLPPVFLTFFLRIHSDNFAHPLHFRYIFDVLTPSLNPQYILSTTPASSALKPRMLHFWIDWHWRAGLSYTAAFSSPRAECGCEEFQSLTCQVAVLFRSWTWGLFPIRAVRSRCACILPFGALRSRVFPDPNPINAAVYKKALRWALFSGTLNRVPRCGRRASKCVRFTSPGHVYAQRRMDRSRYWYWYPFVRLR